MFLGKKIAARRKWSETTKSVIAVVVVGLLMLVTGVLAARADDCAGQCRAHHNQCRIQTKGSPSCDAQLQACLQSCLKPAKK